MLDFQILDIENDESANVNGTSLQGYINESYYNLVDVFGEPTYKAEEKGGFDKVWTEWTLTFKILDEDADSPDDWEYVTATIYDWKEEGPSASRQSGSYQWHVGGKSYMAEDVIQKAIANHFGRQ
tara:strand:+ start:57 stop:431 length:375 start_codon:yes stop_codon:yes gene_type:complete